MPDKNSTRFAIVAALGLVGAAPAPAAERASSFLGRWELDLDKMPVTYGTPPKRVVYAFADVGDGRWKTTIDITAPDDSVRHMALTFRRDGKAVNSEGDLAEGDHAALMSPSDKVLVLSIAKDRALASVRTYTVSDDGRSLTEAAADVDVEGTPFVRLFHFRRIR